MACTVLAALAVGVGANRAGASRTPAQHRPTTASAADSATPPNIVFVMTDDMDQYLMSRLYLPNVYSDIVDRGARFNVEDEESLCCPSRSTILTGDYTQNTGVYSNSGPHGGFQAFHNGLEANDIFGSFHAAGYKTALLGKYFNGYPAPERNPAAGVPNTYVPPNLDYFVSPVAGSPYTGYHYKLNVNGTVDTTYRKSFLTYVLSTLGQRFITQQATSGSPFVMFLDTFTPHSPYGYPRQLANMYTGVPFPEDPSFNEADITDKPYPIDTYPLKTPDEISQINTDYDKRLRGMWAVDQVVGALYQKLQSLGVADNTYFVFGTDNGYYMGQEREPGDAGKYTEFQNTLSIPAAIAGPGIPAGTTLPSSDLIGTIDFAPTFLDMTGATPDTPVDGLSALPVLQGGSSAALDARNCLLIRRGTVPTKQSPDPGNRTIYEPEESYVPTAAQANATMFVGVECRYDGDLWKYVLHTDPRLPPREELYDLGLDPYETQNLLGPDSDPTLLTGEQSGALSFMKQELAALRQCAGTTAAGAADPCDQ